MASCWSRSAPAAAEVDARAPRTRARASRPSGARPVARGRANRGCRAPGPAAAGVAAGARIAPATRRRRVVAAAIAPSRTIELGQGVAGSWLPGRAYSRGLLISPFAPASRADHHVLAEHHRVDAGRSQPRGRARRAPGGRPVARWSSSRSGPGPGAARPHTSVPPAARGSRSRPTSAWRHRSRSPAGAPASPGPQP